MQAFIVNRILQSLIVVLVMTLLVFAGLFVIGDPVQMLVSPDATDIEKEAVRQSLGLDQSFVVQYLSFMRDALHGDLGNSFLTGAPAMDLILKRMPATFELVICAMILATGIGLPLGILAGLRPEARSSKTIMAGSILGFSLPNFWVALVLIMIFAVGLGWVPASGRGETVQIGPIAVSFLTLDGLHHLILPALTLSLTKMALIIRVARAATREVAGQEYIKFARAKGLRKNRIVGVHLLKNIMVPLITVIGLEFGRTAAFAVVTETIFSWPGMGKLLIDSILTLDRPVVVAYLLLMVVFLVFLNLVVDLAYLWLDPAAREKGRD
ncbi:ABC transporter permease [Pseudooceanicola sp. CBS1P-1]|uniref:ABC transporter permease subunit n=1 Tax=Pseudooceanicola albus TaxID=2692189 RepID=A0A6L7G6D4_9RHOB|nr:MULTISPECIES: ABC transporter permease [Pseudooceanicola]MBT9385261.1 ABC transporter permease [Pseudooceanicola endophyticus]MXN18880.1 ABC transporter permease subunit [Pseudooceanicola albus]